MNMTDFGSLNSMNHNTPMSITRNSGSRLKEQHVAFTADKIVE